MKEWFYEVLFVVASSSKTQWAIVLGSVLPVIIILFGKYMLSGFELSGHFIALEPVLVDVFAKRYDKAAIICMVTFYALAFKHYRKAKKKFY